MEIADTKTIWDIDATKKEMEHHLEKTRKKLGKLQDTLYAHGKYAVLVCIQGMDTAGKDSLIREVFKDLNARGVVVHSFKPRLPSKNGTITYGATMWPFPNAENLECLTEPITKTY